MKFWDGVGFQDDEAKNSLDALAGLNSTEFRQVFDRLNFKWSGTTLYDVRQQLVHDAGDLERDPKYAEIIQALESGDPTAVVNAKKAAEDAAVPPTFGDYGFEALAGEEKHAYSVDLYEPKGASEALRVLIESVEFTMQCHLDTLGLGKPKPTPGFLDVRQLVRLDPSSPPLTEKYGHFTGYRHPTGLDAGSGTADPGAAPPPPPAVTAPSPADAPPIAPQQR
ncbi:MULTISPECIES: hypothetical protein [Nocardia]|uniref:hypothetical protein n=1 Tax=Nocardia TaxID=1817 RepID=UPI002456056E|nr:MULTISPECIES: hypothetical protein [Nocardia]